MRLTTAEAHEQILKSKDELLREKDARIADLTRALEREREQVKWHAEAITWLQTHTTSVTTKQDAFSDSSTKTTPPVMKPPRVIKPMLDNALGSWIGGILTIVTAASSSLVIKYPHLAAALAHVVLIDLIYLGVILYCGRRMLQELRKSDVSNHTLQYHIWSLAYNVSGLIFSIGLILQNIHARHYYPVAEDTFLLGVVMTTVFFCLSVPNILGITFYAILHLREKRLSTSQP